MDESSTVTALLNATEALLLEEGYTALSSRRIGERAGVKPPLIHYYFQTIDDLYLAVFRRSIDDSMKNYLAVLHSHRPLADLWEFASHPGQKLGMELLALANHRPALRQEIMAYADKIRDIQVEALTRHFQLKGLSGGIPPIVASVLLTSVSHHLRLESALGTSRGHEETKEYFTAWLERLDAGGADPLDLAGAVDRTG